MIRPLIALTLFTALMSSTVYAKTATKKRDPSSVDRPPQFVMLAFDGSKDVPFWDESMKFADTVATKEGTSLMRWTYFINPTYYLASSNRRTYNTPGIGPGHSCIGFSKTSTEIASRIARTNKAFNSKHEIGSHANAHCDQTGTDSTDPMYGHPWSASDWNSEFSQFNYLLFNAFKINGVKPLDTNYSNGFAFSEKDIVGFRAPKLAVTDGLWPTLSKYNFRYDTSRTSAPDYWPQRQSWGGWNFPLAQIKIAGTNRKTLSMDFNWLAYHSGGVPRKDLSDEEYQRYYNQMLDSYKYYFKKNYFGNRAPIHIGHHFSKWNRGVYWQAMKDFAKFVCNKPEVRCVTYTEYADWLDNLENSRYEAYRKGQFERLRDDYTIQDIATPILADIRLDTGNSRFEAVVADADKNRVTSLGWKPQLQINNQPYATTAVTREQLSEKFKSGESILLRAALLNKSGVPVNWETYRIKNFGTTNESIVGPIENTLLNGEGADAHDDEE